MDTKDELKISYEFQLLIRGSRDGFTSNRFCEICDKRSHTVTVIKVKYSKEILGGYNPIAWEKRDGLFSSYSNTNKSFIFSFRDNEDIEDYILRRVKNDEHAIKNSGPFNPLFAIFGQGDLFLGE